MPRLNGEGGGPGPEVERRFLRRFDFRATVPEGRYWGRLWITPHELRYAGPAAPTIVRHRDELSALWIDPTSSGDRIMATYGTASEGRVVFGTAPSQRTNVWWALHLAGWPLLGGDEPYDEQDRPEWFYCRSACRAGWLIVGRDGIGIETRRTVRSCTRPSVEAIDVSRWRAGRLVIRARGGPRTAVIAPRRDLVLGALRAAGWPVRA